MEKLGEGSFGRVYKCVKNEFGIESECAIKVISIPQSQEELVNMSFEGVTSESAKTYYSDVVNDFANEIKLMEMLKGAPNVVHVENFRIIERKKEIGWDIYIRMELLQSFVNYSLNKKFTEDEVKKFALDISNALEVCSKNGVIHRDIKPANIFVDKFGSFKLGDFGVARRLEGTMSVMSKKGTYSYMAPEVFRGEKYDCRADIYSLGMIMYKLLNRNRDPFVAMDKPVVGFKERNEAIERRRNGEKLPAPVDASPAMAAIILKACEFRAEDRYASVEEFRAALNSLNAPAYVDEPTVAARDFEEQTVAEGVGLYSSQKEKAATDDATVKADPEEATLAARDVDLTVAAPVQANYDEATVVMDDEPTAIDDSEATALADDEATVIADDEPTAIDDGETTVIADADPDATLIADEVYDNSNNGKEEKIAKNKKVNSKTAVLVGIGVLAVIVVIGVVVAFMPTIKQKMLYLQAERALDFGNKANAAILFGQSANYGGNSNALERSFELWDDVSDRQTFAGTKWVEANGDLWQYDSRELGAEPEMLESNIVDVSDGNYFYAALREDGTVVADGSNYFGQCDVDGWLNIVAVSAGYYYTVGLKADGTVVAVGSNTYGGCNVSDWTDIVAVSAADFGYYTVGLKSNGEVVYTDMDVPIDCPFSFVGLEELSSWRDIVSISAGGELCVGIKSDGTAELIEASDCSLYYDAKDGVGFSVDDWQNIIAVSAGENHAVGLKADGTVKSVGGNENGECEVDGWTDIVAVYAHGEYTYGLKSDGTIIVTGGDCEGTEIVSTGADVLNY